MRIGLVGLGRIGAFHAETLVGLPEVDTLVITDARDGIADEVAARLRATGPVAQVEVVAPDALIDAIDRELVDLPLKDKIDHVLERSGLREHYARTTREWAKNLSRNWDECVRLSDLGTARIWGLYLSGSSLGFERNNIQLYQMLGQKLDDRGHGDYPLRPDFR